MTFDFRASQLRTSKIISSGSTGTNAKLLIYPITADGTPANQGNINSSLFGTGFIGQDVFLYVSGAVNGFGGVTGSIALFGGDLVSSGSIYAFGKLGFYSTSFFQAKLQGSLSANRTFDFPDASGTVLLLSKILAGPGITVAQVGTDSVSISASFVTGSSTPLGLGSATSGTSSLVSKEDHIHPPTSSGSFVHTGNFTISGSLWVSSSIVAERGLSGSLQTLHDGTPAFVAGDNITITTQSNGAIAVSASTGPVYTFTDIYENSTIQQISTSFTASNGLGNADLTTFNLSLSASVTATAWGDLPKFTKALECDPWNVDIRARLAYVSGANTNTYIPMSLRRLSDGAALLLIQAKPTTATNAEVTVYDSGGGSHATATITYVNTDNWFRFTTREAHVTVYLGTGSYGEETWKPIWRSTNLTIPTGHTDYVNLTFNIFQNVGATNDTIVRFENIQMTRLN
jgi:hypothetical protein